MGLKRAKALKNRIVATSYIMSGEFSRGDDVLQKNDWNEHEIENRAEWLLANAQNIWKI